MQLATTTIEYVADWATVGAALGTIGLAVATFVLALKTRALAKSGQETADAAKLTAAAAERELELLRDQAEALRDQSKAADAALNASVRPLLIDVPYHTTRTIQVQEKPGEKHPAEVEVSVIWGEVALTARTGRLTVPVRNVGAGVALGLSAAVTVPREDVVGEPIARGNAPSVIPAGETEWVWFEDTAGPASAAANTSLVYLLESGADLVLEVAYSDGAGSQEAATSIYLTKSGRTDRSYRVDKVVPGHARRLTAE